MNIQRIILNAAISACLIVTAKASVVLGNLGVANASGDSAYAEISSDFWYATQFVTGTGASPFNINSVTLNVSNAANTSGNFFVAVFGNIPGSDGEGDLPRLTALSNGNLSGPANPSSAGNYSYTASGLTLNPSTAYWVVAGVTSGSGNYSWNSAANANNSVASTGWDITGRIAFSFNDISGLSWQTDNIDLDHPYKFEINMTAVPEPSEYAACGGVAALGVAGYLRRRRTA